MLQISYHICYRTKQLQKISCIIQDSIAEDRVGLSTRRAPERTMIYSCLTGNEGWDSKIGEYAVTKCGISNAFNAIVETNGTSKRLSKGNIFDPPE
jgi:hypothetical protein